MKIHTSSYKNNIKLFGREIDSKITYTLNGETIELGKTELNSVSPHFRSDILKSAMKQLDIDSNVEIPLNTILSYQFGVKVGNTYEYINYGNYVVYEVEKQEDTRSYKITCFDKMLYSMKDYENLNITYPINIRNYINAICNHLGLTFKNASDEFVNYDKVIQNELYLDSDGNSLGYTFRDVFDELAQVTASTICINEDDDELEIRYITNTGDTIDEEFLKDINVNFGEKYGPVNSIVLSRAESDNVYLKDEDSVTQNGLCEIKIADNQIMNFNDRSDYLPAILNKLDGLEYYLNDFSSTGITFYEICDRYNVEIFGNTYSCVMFNDEINITQGLEENVYTELPEQSETDYTKADKTDRRINQAYIMVDKQNQQIQALASRVIDVSNTISGNRQIQLVNAYEGTLHRLEITGNISCLLVSNDVVVSNTLTPNDTYLVVDSTNRYKLDFTYLNYASVDNHDTYVYEDGKQWVERADGTIEESSEEILIQVKSDSIIKMESFENCNIKATYLLQNEYTENFATQLDVQAQFKITNDSINSKVSAGDVVSEINQSADEIKIVGNRFIVESTNFNLTKDGKMSSVSGDVGGFTIDQKDLSADIKDKYIYTSNDYVELRGIIANNIVPTQEQLDKYDIDKNGVLDEWDLTMLQWKITDYSSTEGKFILSTDDANNSIIFTGNGTEETKTTIGISRITSNWITGTVIRTTPIGTDETIIDSNGIVTPVVTQTSLEEHKKDFEKFNNGLETIKNIDIYKYHLKNENDDIKKHIGFVIGNKFNYSKDTTSNDNKGVDIYSFVSVCCQAIKEQQAQIEELKKEIELLKGEK